MDKNLFKKYLLQTKQATTFKAWNENTEEPEIITCPDIAMALLYIDKCELNDFSEFVFNSGKYSKQDFAEWLREEENL